MDLVFARSVRTDMTTSEDPDSDNDDDNNNNDDDNNDNDDGDDDDNDNDNNDNGDDDDNDNGKDDVKDGGTYIPTSHQPIITPRYTSICINKSSPKATSIMSIKNGFNLDHSNIHYCDHPVS